MPKPAGTFVQGVANCFLLNLLLRAMRPDAEEVNPSALCCKEPKSGYLLLLKNYSHRDRPKVSPRLVDFPRIREGHVIGGDIRNR